MVARWRVVAKRNRYLPSTIHYLLLTILIGADEWDRTTTISRSRASETRASANSATSARIGRVSIYEHVRESVKQVKIEITDSLAVTSTRYQSQKPS